MDELKTTTQDDHTWRALAAIKELAAAKRTSGVADAALEAIREKLFQIHPSGAVGDSAPPKFQSTISRMTGQGEEVEAVIDWLASTGRFKKKSIQHIRRVKVFAAQESGRVIIRAQPLSERQATVAIIILSVSGLLGSGLVLLGAFS